jgi:hypothetical protein
MFEKIKKIKKKTSLKINCCVWGGRWFETLRVCGREMGLEPSWFLCCWFGINTGGSARCRGRKRDDGARTLHVENGAFHPGERVLRAGAGVAAQMFSLFIQKICISCDKNYSEDVLTGIPIHVKLLCHLQGVKGTQKI